MKLIRSSIKFAFICMLAAQIEDLVRPTIRLQPFWTSRGAIASATPVFFVDPGGSTDQATIFDFGTPSAAVAAGPPHRRQAAAGDQSAGGLAEYLAGLPISSVGQKHAAAFECDVGNSREPSGGKFKLVWIKLVTRQTNNGTAGRQWENDITPLSLDGRVITPDKRFKVQHRPPHKWLLTIDNVGPPDDKAFYLCQSSGGGGGGGGGGGAQGSSNGFIGGARLNVLVPPKLEERETSANLISAAEFEPLKLTCKVVGEPQAQIVWRREDGRPLEGLEQRFRHQLDRSQAGRLISIDSSELLFESLRREQAGAYLCIASNGVQPGVSQRISVTVVKCREHERADSASADCDQRSAAGSDAQTTSAQQRDVTQPNDDHRRVEERPSTSTTIAAAATTTTTTTSTASTPTGKPQQSRSKWKLSSLGAGGLAGRLQPGGNHSSSSANQQRVGQTAGRFPAADKTRTRPHHTEANHKNDRALAIGANNRRLLAEMGADDDRDQDQSNGSNGLRPRAILSAQWLTLAAAAAGAALTWAVLCDSAYNAPVT